MATHKYKCNNCNKIFPGDDYTQECPHCGSHDIIPVNGPSGEGIGKIIKWVQDNKLIVGILTAIVIVVIFLNKGCGGDEELSYEVVVTPYTGYVEVNILKHFKPSGADRIEMDTLNFSNYVADFDFRDKEGNAIIFQNDNKYYPCDPNVYIQWDFTTAYPKKTGAIIDWWLSITFSNDKPDIKAGCAVPLEIISVEPNNNCEIVITTNLDAIAGKEIMVSINGQHGQYELEKVWGAKTYSKLDIWAYDKDKDTSKVPPIPFQRNGDVFKAICPMDQESINEIKSAFISLGNDYGRNPNNGTKRNAFMDLLLNSTSPSIYIDGTLLTGGKSEMQIVMYSSYFNVPKTTYRIDEPSVVINNNGVITSFKFKSSQ